MDVYNLEKMDRILKAIMAKLRKMRWKVVFAVAENRRITGNMEENFRKMAKVISS